MFDPVGVAGRLQAAATASKPRQIQAFRSVMFLIDFPPVIANLIPQIQTLDSYSNDQPALLHKDDHSRVESQLPPCER